MESEHNMENSKKSVKRILGVIVIAIVLFVGLWHLGDVAKAVSMVLRQLTFFIVGLCLAFLLNPLLSMIEDLLFAPLNRRLGARWVRIRRVLSLILTYLSALSLLASVLLVVIPQVVTTVSTLSSKLPAFVQEVTTWYQGIQATNPDSIIVSFLDTINLTALGDEVRAWLQIHGNELLTGTFSAASSFSTSLFSFVLGMVLSVYILADKERLSRQVKRVLCAFLSERASSRVLVVAGKANETFRGFFVGQFTEAVVLGVLMFIGMTIFRFPYALVVALLIAILSFIPYFGAFVSATLGALLILIDGGVIQALYFVLFFIALQQLDGLLIYPRIVGKSMRLPGMWVLSAATVGGKIGGIVGILISVPLCALCYSLAQMAVVEREKRTLSVQQPSQTD